MCTNDINIHVEKNYRPYILNIPGKGGGGTPPPRYGHESQSRIGSLHAQTTNHTHYGVRVYVLGYCVLHFAWRGVARRVTCG